MSETTAPRPDQPKADPETLVLKAAPRRVVRFKRRLLIGIAAGSFYAPMMALASAWIDKHRSLAVALVSAGMGVSPVTVAPSASMLITAYDWRTAMLVIGLASWALLIPACFLIRPAPPAARRNPSCAAARRP